LEIFSSYKKLMVISFKIFMELLSRITMSFKPSQQHGNELPTGASSNTVPTGAKTTAAELVAALQKARAAKAAADAAAAAIAASYLAAANAAANAADSTARVAAARVAARTASKRSGDSKLGLNQQRITEAADAAKAAAAAAKAKRQVEYESEHKSWKALFDEAKANLDACAKAIGEYSKYLHAVPFARVGPEFDQLCSDCKSLDMNVATAAENLKQLVNEYQELLAEKAEAVKKVAKEEPEHPDVVFKRQFAIFIQKNEAINRILLSLLEGRAVYSMKFVAARIDPNFLGMFGGLFSLSSVDDSVTLNPIQLPSYDPSKDKAKAGRAAFHLWFLQHVIFSFIQNRLVPLVDEQSCLTLDDLMLNYKYILPMHIHDRDAQIAEHSANIQNTMEYHLHLKEKKQRKNREATHEEFERHIRACDEHSRKKADLEERSTKLRNDLVDFLKNRDNADLLLCLQTYGIQDNESAWRNLTASTHQLMQFLTENGLPNFEDAIRFLQQAGIIADRVSQIPTKRNQTREAFAFIFGTNDKSSSENEDDSVEHAAESAPEKTQKPSKKDLRIIRGDDDFTIANAIREAKLVKELPASNESPFAEESSAKEQTDAKLQPSPPAPFSPAKPLFVLSISDAEDIASENGVEAGTVMMVSMMTGAQSYSAASRPDVINAAKHIEAQIAAEKKAAEEKAAKEAAKSFKDAAIEEKRKILLDRLAKKRSNLNSGSVGGGASASDVVVSSTEEGGRLTLKQLTSHNGEVINIECKNLLSRLKAASKNADQKSAEPNE